MKIPTSRISFDFKSKTRQRATVKTIDIRKWNIIKNSKLENGKTMGNIRSLCRHSPSSAFREQCTSILNEQNGGAFRIQTNRDLKQCSNPCKGWNACYWSA